METPIETKELSVITAFDDVTKNIETMRKECMAITIKDKESFQHAHRARIAIKRTRVRLDQIKEELCAPVLQQHRDILSAYREIKSQIDPIYNHLDAQEQSYVQEQRRILLEKRLEAANRIAKRINEIRDISPLITCSTMENGEFILHWMSKRNTFSFPDTRKFAKMSDKSFARLCRKVKEAHDEHQKIENAIRLENERQRILEEQRLEAEKLAKQLESATEGITIEAPASPAVTVMSSEPVQDAVENDIVTPEPNNEESQDADFVTPDVTFMSALKAVQELYQELVDLKPMLVQARDSLQSMCKMQDCPGPVFEYHNATFPAMDKIIDNIQTINKVTPCHKNV